jgi:hypothetical protein
VKQNPTRTLARILAGDAQIAQWHERMQREAQLTTAVRRMLPRALADRVRVALAAPTTLRLVVPAGAIAAVIRQRSPDLLANLRREGVHFTEIEVRVQVGANPGPPRKTSYNQVNRLNPAPLKAVASTLPAGPLKEAILRLARRGG